MVERDLAKVEVAGSSPVSRSTLLVLSLSLFHPITPEPRDPGELVCQVVAVHEQDFRGSREECCTVLRPCSLSIFH